MKLDWGLQRQGGGGWTQEMDSRSIRMWTMMKNVDKGIRFCGGKQREVYKGAQGY